MSIKEIEKLREKVEKDQNSKLFVPLAEEYRKVGMLDEATEVLQKGLQRQPGYMSAKVSLGKIYLEKGQREEARVEFEDVIKSIPDNLFAHKKLAEIYRDTGSKDLAIKAFRKVLKLNPMDEETLSNLRDLEGASTEQQAGGIQDVSTQPEEEPVSAEEENPFESMVLEDNSQKQEESQPEESGEDLDAFKKSLFGADAEVVEEIPEDARAVETDSTKAGEITEDVEEGWSFGEAENAQEIETGEEDVTEVEDIPEDADKELSFGEMADVLKTEVLETDEKPETVEKFSPEVYSAVGSISPTDNSELLKTADRFISEGKYLAAINSYQQIIAAAPEDKKTLQRIEELRSLLKLMGKDKEVLISKLNAFLSAIKKRGDEFSGSS
jgi:tetratricopeptide (TPR) repeat protein